MPAALAATMARDGILAHLETIEDEQPDIGFVVEKAASPLEIVIDGRGAPRTPKG